MVAPLVDPTSEVNTHHLALTDMHDTLGLVLCDAQGNPIPLAIDEGASPATALRVSNGAGGYDDYQQPYTPIAQTTWEGGLGSEFFDQDASRYLDGNCVDTSKGKIMPAGQALERTIPITYAIDEWITGDPLTLSWKALTSGKELAWSDTPGALSLRRILISMKVSAACRFNVSMRITPDSGGLPAGTTSTIATGTAVIEETGYFRIHVNIKASLSAATKYWYCMTVSGITNGATVSVQYQAETGSDIVEDLAVIYANQIVSSRYYEQNHDGVRFFEFRNLVYAITVSEDGAAPRLYTMGYRGLAASNSGRFMQKIVLGGNAPMTSIGSYAIILNGPGATEKNNWRYITNDDAATVLAVSEAWRIEHTTSTEYVIVDPDYPEIPEITGHGLTGKITDICVVDDRVYFCQGSEANVRRMTYTPNATPNTGHAWTDEGCQADFIEMYTDVDGKKRLFMGIAATSVVYKCEVGVALTGRTQVNNSLPVGSGDSWITNIGVYDDPQRPFILKEDGFGSISNGVYGPIPIGNVMRAVRSRKNGQAWCTNDRFLYFSMGPKLMRYYAGDLSNIGPDQDYGLPADRRGNITHVVAYPGGVLYAAIDAGSTGYSSVLKYNGQGWCEVWRAELGRTITGLFVLNIPGQDYQKLLIGCGDYIYHLYIASNPLQATDFLFAETCSLTTGWFRTAYKDVRKFFNSVKLFLVNNSTTKTALVQYRTDTSTTWLTLGTYTAGNPSEEIEFNASTDVSIDVTGLRIQLKITLSTNDSAIPVYIEQLLVETVTRIPTKRSWHITARVYDQGHDLQGNMEELSAAEIKALMERWANSDEHAGRLLVRSMLAAFDQKRVFLEPGSFRVLRVDPSEAGARRSSLIARMTLIEA